MKRVVMRLLRWTASLYLIYVGLSLLVIFPALNILTPGLVKDALNREFRSEIILFNPFTLALEVRRGSLEETDGHQPLALKRVKLDLSTSSIWQPGIVLDAFLIDELEIHVLRYEDGRFHFDDLIPSDPGEPASDDASPLPAITIQTLALDARSIRYTDRTRPGPFEAELSALSLRKRNLTTVPDREGNGALEVTGDGGGRLAWQGDSNIAAGNSTGVLTLENIDLRPGWRYEAESLRFVTHSARLDARLAYRASWTDTTEFFLQDSQLRLHSVDLRPTEALKLDDTGIVLGELLLDGITLDLDAQTAAVSSITIGELNVQGYDENGVASLQTMFLEDQEPEVKDTTATGGEAEADATVTDDKWSVSVASFDLDNSAIRWRTDFLTPDLMHITPLKFSAANIHWPAEAPSPFSIELAINNTAHTRAEGNLHLGDGSASIQANIEAFPIPWINPVVHETLRTDINSGALSLQTELQLNEFAPALITTALQIDNFATVLHETGQEAFSLKKLTVTDAQLDLSAQSLRVAELALQAPRGSLHILEDGRMNINGIVRGGSDGHEEAAETGAEASASPEGPGAQSAWQVALDKVTLREGRLDFADASLPLPFETVIDNIQADASDIDTAAEEPLELLFSGSVDGYAPVRIEGSGRPLAEARDGVLQLDFQGMDIATMSPYSGTYAGYTIDSGTLSLNLRYALDGQKLDGDNRVQISQMQLGEPIESELAIDVPLKLGLALLTDSQGLIDLRVPVSGNVDDPSFSLGPIIGMALKNIIVKAVTAPFRLLAGLVGSEEDLENIAFTAGEDTLEPAAIAALDSLAEALTQRPQLQLRIIGGSDAVQDADALRARDLEQSLIEDGLSEASIEARDMRFMEAIGARYAQLLATDAANDQSAEPASEEVPAPSIAQQYERILETIVVSPNALQSLGTSRAAAAKRELVNAGAIDAARIAISYDSMLGMTGAKMAVDS